MFHAAELKRRNQDKIELPEAIWNSRVFLEPLERRSVKIEYGFLVAFDLLCIRLAMEHAVPASIAFCRLHLKFACSESEEVGRNRLRFGVPNSNAISTGLVKSLGTVCNRLPV